MNITGLFRAGFLQVFALIVTALLAPSLARAQSIYSANALGYVDANFVAGSNLIANPLFASDNTVSNLFRGVPDGTFFLPWNQGLQGFGPTNRFSSVTGWTTPTATFLAPNGAFLWLPSSTTISFVGEPWSLKLGPPCLTYPQGPSVWSWLPLRGCGVICENPDVPCPPSGIETAQFLTWNPGAQAFNDIILYYDGFWYPQAPSISLTESAVVVAGFPLTARSPFAAGTPFTPVPTGTPGERLQAPQLYGNNLIFGVPTASNINYTVFCSTNLAQNQWRPVQQGVGVASNGMARLSIVQTNHLALYRVLPQFSGTNPVLFSGNREGRRFNFQFYAPVTTNYIVDRTLNFGNPINTGTWQPVKTITAGAGNIVIVADDSASAATGYYRVRY